MRKLAVSRNRAAPWLNCYRFYDTDNVSRCPVACKMYVRDPKVSAVICGDFCKTGVTYF